MKLRLHTLLIICCALLSTPRVSAQIDSLVFIADSARVQPEAKGELRVSIDALAFFRDNEYNSADVTRGYTLPGMWLMPTVSYQPLRNLRMEVGAYMLHYWGANTYPNANYTNLAEAESQGTSKAFHCTPVFRANLQIDPHVNVVLGSLYGRSAHGLVEPLYNPEMNLTADPETGLQVLWRNHWLNFDAWVNWQNFIFKNDDEQERFTFGLSTRFLPSRSAARVQWYLPLQLLMHHRGGEINPSAPNRGVKTWLNAAAGVGMKAPLRTRVPVTLGGEVTATYFSQQKGTDLPFDSGYGLMAKAEARIWHFGLTVGYWQAHRFISVYGSPLFGAVSNSKSNTTIDRPHMAFAHLEYAQSLGRGFSWGVQIDADQHWQRGIHNRTEKAYTTPSSTTDFAAGIFLRMTPSFLIKKFGAK